MESDPIGLAGGLDTYGYVGVNRRARAGEGGVAFMKRLKVPKSLAGRSIESIEKDRWEEPGPGASGIALRCHKLRQKNIEDLTVSDIRLLIGQDIGLHFLIPIALKLLEKDPLVESDHYRGDLLAAVLRADPGYFARNAAERSILSRVMNSTKLEINSLDHIDFDTTYEALNEAEQVFDLGQRVYGRSDRGE